VIDALLATGLAGAGELEVTAADINPRVVDHLRRARSAPPRLQLATDIVEKDGLTFSREYREYFADLGTWLSSPPAAVRAEEDDEGRLRKSVPVSAALARVLRAEPLDIVTERLTAAPFDLVIATNILPYFDDRQLALAASNISAMIVPGGVFLHNEARPILGELTTAAGLPFEQSRRTVIATITGAPPLGDSIFIHTKR
jgi:predicted RNA methylase